MCQLWSVSSSALCQVGTGGPLPLLNINRLFHASSPTLHLPFLFFFWFCKHWSQVSSDVSCSLHCVLSLPPSYSVPVLLCLCSPPPAESGRIHEPVGGGYHWGWDWDILKERCIFHFFSTISVCFFFLTKCIHFLKTTEKGGSKVETSYGRKIIWG